MFRGGLAVSLYGFRIALPRLSPPDGCGETRALMSNEPTPNTEQEPSEAPRTRRARSEPMAVSLFRTSGQYEVRVASGRLYEVDLTQPACSCPDWQIRQPPGGCKHLRRVTMEIETGNVAGPAGQLSSPSVVALTPENTANADRLITGPHTEYDSRERPTGSVFYRCSVCNREACRRTDIEHTAICHRSP